MKIEGVTFVDAAVLEMSKDEFVETHLPYFWKDRSEDDRRKMLEDAYELICR